MAFKVIEEPKQMDALWYAGLLWCRDYDEEEGVWGEWWVDRAEDWDISANSEPSKFLSEHPRCQFGILLED